MGANTPQPYIPTAFLFRLHLWDIFMIMFGNRNIPGEGKGSIFSTRSSSLMCIHRTNL